MNFSGGWNVKTKKQRELERLRAAMVKLEEQVTARQKKILSRQSIRDWDFKKMTDEKAALEKDDRELGKLKRKIERMEGNLK